MLRTPREMRLGRVYRHQPHRQVAIVLRHERSTFEQDVQGVVACLVPELRGAPDVMIEKFGDGWTNSTLKVASSERRVAVVVRLFGPFTEYLVDRKQERAVMATYGLRVFGGFLNGCVYAFTRGRPLTPQDIGDVRVRRMVARAIAAFHRLRPPFKRRPQIFSQCRQLLNNLPPFYPGRPRAETEQAPSFEYLSRQVDEVEKQIAALHSRVVLCHNDLTLKNFVFDEQQGVVRLIDFEYSGWGFQAFDLANHFCEWCGEAMDWSQFPDEPQMTAFLRLYLESFTTRAPSEDRVVALLAQVKAFLPAVNLWWAIWGFANASLADNNIDYLAYASRRLERYKSLTAKHQTQ